MLAAASVVIQKPIHKTKKSPNLFHFRFTEIKILPNGKSDQLRKGSRVEMDVFFLQLFNSNLSNSYTL